MEMHQIRYFLAVCEHGSFTRAAQFCFISQPSLTQAIKKLEDELGGELFLRDRSGCQLTSLGRLIEPGLRGILTEMQATKSEALRFSRLKTLPLRVGLMQTIGAQRLSPFLASYQHEHPQIELELIIDQESALMNQLETDLLDLVITSPAQLFGEPYRATLLYEEKYAVVFARGHRFNQMTRIELKDIQFEPYLDRLNCELREKLKTICHDLEINLYAAYRSNSEQWIINMVGSGLGVALMPEYTLPKQSEEIKWRYLAAPEIGRKVYAICKPNMSKKHQLNALIAKLQGGR